MKLSLVNLSHADLVLLRWGTKIQDNLNIEEND